VLYLLLPYQQDFPKENYTPSHSDKWRSQSVEAVAVGVSSIELLCVRLIYAYGVFTNRVYSQFIDFLTCIKDILYKQKKYIQFYLPNGLGFVPRVAWRFIASGVEEELLVCMRPQYRIWSRSSSGACSSSLIG